MRPLGLTDWVGLGGALLIGALYFANQLGRLPSDDWRFPAGNLAGSIVIGVSLAFAFNLPSVFIELLWSGISLFGLVRALRRRWAA